MMESKFHENTKLLDETRGTGNGSGISDLRTWTTRLRGILALIAAAILVTVSRVSVEALDKAIPDLLW